MFVKDGKSFTLTDIRRAHPDTSFPAGPVFDPSSLGYEPLTLTERPTGDVVEPADPVQVDGVWTQQWSVREFTAEEKASRAPRSVTMRQARLALLQAGLLNHVAQAISQASMAVQIEWEYAATVERGNDLTLSIAAGLGMTSEQIDALFVTAASL